MIELNLNTDRPVSAYTILQDRFMEQLSKHPIVVANITDDVFCGEIWGSLTNTVVQVSPDTMSLSEESRKIVFNEMLSKGNEVLDVSASFRASGRLVAELRNTMLGDTPGYVTESYMDWYCSGESETLSPRMAKIYKDLSVTWSEWVQYGR